METIVENSRTPASSRGGLVLIFLVLFAPSLFLLSTTPPLWRDTDAWQQVTSPPNVSTLVHFGTAYCFGARGPMWIGSLVGAALGHNEWPKSNFFRSPVVTDDGVTALLLTQHLLLTGALTLLVIAASSRWKVRGALVAVCVVQAPIYAYAHCVGTETLTIILIIVLTAMLRWVGDRDRLNPRMWGAYFGLLLLAILTRHPNAVLAGLLPGAFLFQALITGIRTGKWKALRCWTRPVILATLAGLVTIGAAKGLNRIFCWSGNQAYRSTAGYTLQWKLGYMSEMTPGARRVYWQEVLGPNATNEFSDLILGINVDQMKKDGFWQPRTFYLQVLDEIVAKNPAGRKGDAVAEAEIALNSLVRPFLIRGGAPYWNSVQHDALQGFTWTPEAISSQLIDNTTKYYADPSLAGQPRNQPIYELITFKDRDAKSVRATFENNPWFSVVPKILPPHWVYLLAALLLAVGLMRFSDPISWDGASAILSMLACGLLMWFLTKLLTQDLPRFAAPLYTILFTAVVYGMGRFVDGLRSRAPGECFGG